MPEALAGLIVGALHVGALAAGVLTATLTIGLSLGLNALIKAVFKTGGPKPSDGQSVLTQSVASRDRRYGIGLAGGLMSFFESTNGTLGMVVTHSTGKGSDIVEHRINDKVVSVDGSGTITDASFHGAVHIHSRDGDDNQAAISELTAKFPQWTSDHRQRGCVHTAVICDPVKQELFSEVYNSQRPQYTQARKWCWVYDPRLDSTAVIYDDGAGFTIHGTGPQRLDDASTWAWSDNAALVIGDYAAHLDGYGLGTDNVNWINIAGEASVSDQTVATVTEEVIARWRLWVRYQLSVDERRQVLADMLKACDGMSWQDANGKFCMRVGRYTAPAVTITDDHILSMVPAIGPTSDQRVSALKMLYTEASIGYREQESALVGDPAGAVDPNTKPQGVEVFFAPHHNQAVRLGKIMFAQLGDERWHIDAQLNLFGLNLIGEAICRLESVALGVSADFKIQDGLKIDFDKMVVACSLIEVKPEDWDFDAATEEGTPPAAVASGGSPPVIVIEVPAGLALTTVQVLIADAWGTGIQATWTAPSRPDLVAEVQYRASGASDWFEMTVQQDDRLATSGVVSTGLEYEVRARFITIAGRQSAWSASETITPIAATGSAVTYGGVLVSFVGEPVMEG